ncbi:MAG TPA: AtzG-like protein [Acetobacteraceae bacterium]|nr:AtzG-like protein [Acetobacteraceae bacterium]
MTDAPAPPDAAAIASYVRAAAPLAGLALDPERERAVIAAFALVSRIAAPALAYPLPRMTEPPAISAVPPEP